MNELVLQLRDALDTGDDHRAARVLEQLFARAERKSRRRALGARRRGARPAPTERPRPGGRP